MGSEEECEGLIIRRAGVEMFSPENAYGKEKTTLENPSVYELADDLEDPSREKKLVEKDSVISITSMLSKNR